MSSWLFESSVARIPTQNIDEGEEEKEEEEAVTAVQRVSTQLPRHRRLSRTGFLSTTTTTILVLRPVPENRSKNQETVSRKNKQRHPPAPPTQRLPLGPGWQPTTTIYRRDWLARILPSNVRPGVRNPLAPERDICPICRDFENKKSLSLCSSRLLRLAALHCHCRVARDTLGWQRLGSFSQPSSPDSLAFRPSSFHHLDAI